MNKTELLNLTDKIKQIPLKKLEDLIQASFKYFNIKTSNTKLKKLAKESDDVRHFASQIVENIYGDSSQEFQILLILLEGYWLHIPKKYLDNRSEFELEEEHFSYSPVGRFIIELKNQFIINYFKKSFPVALTQAEHNKIRKAIEKKWLKEPNKDLGGAIPTEILQKDLAGKVEMEPHLNGFKFFVKNDHGRVANISIEKNNNIDNKKTKADPANKKLEKNIIEKKFLIDQNSKFKDNVGENIKILNKVFDNIQDQGIEVQLSVIQLWLKYTKQKKVETGKTNLYAAALEFSIRQKEDRSAPPHDLMNNVSDKYQEKPEDIANLAKDIMGSEE